MWVKNNQSFELRQWDPIFFPFWRRRRRNEVSIDQSEQKSLVSSETSFTVIRHEHGLINTLVVAASYNNRKSKN